MYVISLNLAISPLLAIQGGVDSRCSWLVSCRDDPISFPNVSMKKWISQLLGREEALPCVKSVARDNMRLTVSAYEKGCGHPGYLVEMFFCFEPEVRWEQVAVLAGESLPTAIYLLMEAERHVSRTLTEKFNVELVDD